MVLVSFFHISAQISINWKKLISIFTLGHTLNISSQYLFNLFRVTPKMEIEISLFQFTRIRAEMLKNDTT